MWKLLVAFIVFAIAAIFLLMKGGANVDMGGEKHGAEATHVEEGAVHEAASAPASAPAPLAAPAASAPASAASALAPL